VDWFAFSIAGAACLAVTGIIDKFYLGRYVRNTLAYLFVLVVIQQVFLLPVLAYAGLEFVYPQSLYALSIGVVQVILWAAYLRALKVEETSRIAGDNCLKQIANALSFLIEGSSDIWQGMAEMNLLSYRLAWKMKMQ